MNTYYDWPNVVYSTCIRKRMYMRAVIEEKSAIEFKTPANSSALT